MRINKFSRSLLQLSIKHEEHPELPPIEVLAAHLKSKLPTRLDEEESNNEATRTHSTALGSALSTIRRTAEAAALRIILTQQMKKTDTPFVVLGDLNDGQLSNTLSIITEQPSYRLYASSRRGSKSDVGLYAAGTLQALRSLSDVYYTHIYEGIREILDHVLVSEQFYAYSSKRVWSFREMRIWNDFIEDDDKVTSDHGVVRAYFDYDPR
ncbi:endonuclease/exonuclease/phosphatase family protein [bacterium]|nr:endonuclease/exonuclease/phosphatase family protein [bacterium]